MKINSSPKKDGYVLMADFDHDATLVLFPYRKEVWNNCKEAQRIHLELIEKIAQYERVYVGVRKNERGIFSNFHAKNVVVFELEQDDAWIRDSGPLFVKKGDDVRMVRNNFNAWGGLYDDWSHDLKITENLSQRFDCDYYENDFVLEGGNITTDGKGTAILVQNCIVNSNRNSRSKTEIENLLKEGLGLERIVWLKDGFVEDETGGHIDNVCRFLPNGEIVIAWTDEKSNPMYERCRQIEKELHMQIPEIPVHKFITPSAQYRLETETVDCEGAKKRLSEELLTASYINYYETDRAVFVPQFGVKEDKIAERQFEQLFVGRDIIPMFTREYILAGGGIHCLTLGVNFKERQA